jgi:hypothetical protein
MLLDTELGGNLLQNAKRDMNEAEKRIMALRHGNNLKILIQYMRSLWRGSSKKAKNLKIQELKLLMSPDTAKLEDLGVLRMNIPIKR